MSDHRAAWVIEPAVGADRSAWARLYRSYGAGAGDELSDEHLATVWNWILDPAAQTRCLLLRRSGQQRPVGLAHYRVFERPLAGTLGCHLDDLFVSDAERGRGGARALLGRLSATAEEQSWTVVRWTTGESNPARTLYDSLAERSPVVTYNLTPGASG